MKLAIISLAFACGCMLPWLLPWLPPQWTLLPLAAVLVVARTGWRRVAMILFLAGFGYGLFAAHTTNSHQLPDRSAGLDARVRGQVVGLPQHQDQRVRFLFAVDQFESTQFPDITAPPRLLRLTWYYPNDVLQVGDIRDFEVRLRRPRGLVNPPQFDYRQWLLAEGIDATGYVRQSLGKSGQNASWVDRWRESQSRFLSSSTQLQHADLIAALGIGDRSAIDAEGWQLFAATGVIHLMVISGLHIGFAALLGFWCGSLLLRPLIFLRFARSAQDIGWVVAVLSAFLYALCAGFSTPTLRAFLMVSLLGVAKLLRLRVSIWTVLSLAFALVMVGQPRSILSSGLWLSFGAVVALVAAFQGAARQSWWLGLVRAQLVLFLGFSALPLALGNAVPLTAPFANLVAVPLVGMAVVPLILVGLMAGLVSLQLQQWFWLKADWLLEILDLGLSWLASLTWPQIYPPDTGTLTTLILILSGFGLIAVPWRARLWPLLLLALAPVYLPRTEGTFLQVHFFDVGQGTAVLIRQPGYELLYDTGPAFSTSFNAGRDILVPILARSKRPDREFIVSHSDSDHAGGAQAVVESGWQTGRIFTGEPLGLGAAEMPCKAGESWQVGEVGYAFVHPAETFQSGDNNNRSCVLLISFGSRHLLLPGDISRSVEQSLLAGELLPGSIDLLMVPHHGSATSSSEALVQRLEPALAVISSGYGNQFGHPVAAVVERYQKVGSQILDTATDGAISISWATQDAEPVVERARDGFKLWWQE